MEEIKLKKEKKKWLVKEKKLLKAIKMKYKTQAIKAAKESQRDYVKDVNKSKMMTVADLNNRNKDE